GSYGWGGKAVETLAGMLPNLKAEILPPVMVKGLPQDEDLKKIDDLAAAIALRHRGPVG
ncbi:MAG TPA: MBL fold hydrolase, partial [Elusimicrobia bacterium]|nr:MBL fold hydrolase [Elusimicrobiota bacterium]